MDCATPISECVTCFVSRCHLRWETMKKPMDTLDLPWSSKKKRLIRAASKQTPTVTSCSLLRGFSSNRRSALNGWFWKNCDIFLFGKKNETSGISWNCCFYPFGENVNLQLICDKTLGESLIIFRKHQKEKALFSSRDQTFNICMSRSHVRLHIHLEIPPGFGICEFFGDSGVPKICLGTSQNCVTDRAFFAKVHTEATDFFVPSWFMNKQALGRYNFSSSQTSKKHVQLMKLPN